MEPMKIIKAGAPSSTGLKSIQPESITADKAQMPFLMCEQVNRINFLLTIGMTATTENRQVADITRGVLFGLRTLESMMACDLDEKYYKKVGLFKENLPSSLYGIRDMDNPVFLWFDELVRQSERFGMIPLKKVIFEFDESEAWK